MHTKTWEPIKVQVYMEIHNPIKTQLRDEKKEQNTMINPRAIPRGASYMKSIFETYFDGCYGVEPQHEDNPSTFSMGVCKLEYNEEDEILMVHLRRPGLLIGKAGRTINALQEWLECKVHITEIKKF